MLSFLKQLLMKKENWRNITAENKEQYQYPGWQCIQTCQLSRFDRETPGMECCPPVSRSSIKNSREWSHKPLVEKWLIKLTSANFRRARDADDSLRSHAFSTEKACLRHNLSIHVQYYGTLQRWSCS